jgi:hypothetical protein
MRIVVDVNHPGQVHYYRHFIREMEKRGHDVLITASEKEVSYRLLDRFGFRYVRLGSYGDSLFRKMVSFFLLELRMIDAARRFGPDVFVSHASVRTGLASRLLGKKNITFDDTEHAKSIHMLFEPFSDVILTPLFYKKDLGGRHLRFDGFSQLASTHPNYFRPDPSVLDDLGLGIDEIFTVVRLVSWNASHDVGHHGIRDRLRAVRELERLGRVFVSAEGRLGPELERYRLRIAPEKLHDLLYYSSLCFSEGGTTAIEAALLGTHAIHVSSTAKYCGVFDDLNRYGLLWISEDSGESLRRAGELLSTPGIKEQGREKLKRLLGDKIDVTQFMVWFVEHYPESYREMKARPEIQYQFRGNAR